MLVCAVTLALVLRFKRIPEPLLIAAAGIVGLLVKGALVVH